MSYVQISDLHICEKTNEGLIRNFTKLKTLIYDLPIIICGDIFDKKSYCKGEDLLTLHKIFDIFVDNSIYIIPGDSDFEYGHNSNLLDNIKIEKDNVTIITKNRETRIDGKNFLFLPPTDYDGISEFLKSDKKYDFVVCYEKDKSKITQYNLPGSQNYMCGGIHDSKEYNFGPNRYLYSGSFGRRYNEKKCRKYIIWNGTVPKIENIILEEEKFCYYKNDKIEEGEEIDQKNLTNITNIYVHFRNCTEYFMAEKKESVRNILNKFKTISVEFINIIKPHERINNVSNITTDLDFYSLETQLKLIREKTDDDAMVDLHKEYYKKFMGDQNTTKHWKIDKMYWSNLFCYRGENFLDFRDLNGLTTVIGKNGLGKTSLINIITLGLYGLLSNAIVPPENICYTGCDRWTIVLYISTYSSDIDGKMTKERYIIRRSGGKDGLSLYLYKIEDISDGTGRSRIVNITKYVTDITQEKICKILGTSEEFISTNVMCQNTKYYVDRSAKEITESILNTSYVSNFIRIEKSVEKTINDIQTEIRKKKHEIKGATEIAGKKDLKDVDLKKLENDYEEIIRQKEQVQKEYDSLPKINGEINLIDYTELLLYYKSLSGNKYNLTKLEELESLLKRLNPPNFEYFIRYAEHKILDIQNYRTILKKHGVTEEETQSIYLKSKANTDEKIEEILTRSKSIPELSILKISKIDKPQKIEKTSKEYLAYKKYLDKIGGFAEFKAIEKSINKAVEIISESTLESSPFDPINFDKASELDLNLFGNEYIAKKLVFDDQCECCKKNKSVLISEPDQIKWLKMFVSIYISGHYTDYISAQNNIVIAEKLRLFKSIPDQIHESIQKYQQWLITNKISEEKLISSVENTIHLTPTNDEVIKYITSIGIDEYRKKIEELVTKKTTLQKKSEDILIRITQIKKNIENKQKIEKLLAELEILNKKLGSYEKYLSLVKNDGICRNILDLYADKLNKNINNILHCITNFTVKISLTENNTLKIIIPEKNINAFQCSGGQKFIIDIAIRISLLNISRDRPKFIIIDEGFGSLDGEHLENIQTFMKVIDDFYKKEKNWILFVSHINELRDISSNKININLINDRSFINNISAEELEKNKKIISDLGSIKSASEPSINDFTLDQDGKYYCQYCKKSYVFGRINNHLSTEAHKKNYINEYKKR